MEFTASTSNNFCYDSTFCLTDRARCSDQREIEFIIGLFFLISIILWFKTLKNFRQTEKIRVKEGGS